MKQPFSSDVKAPAGNPADPGDPPGPHSGRADSPGWAHPGPVDPPTAQNPAAVSRVDTRAGQRHGSRGSRFTGRVAIVTGGAAGIGRAVATRLAEEGASVALVDRDSEQLAKTAAEIGAGAQIVADVSDEQEVADYVRQIVDQLGRVDLFFNNAGIEGPRKPIVELDVRDFDEVMAVNARGVFLGLREVMRALFRQDRGGSIVNTASMAGVRGGPNFSPYIASKHTVVGLTRSAAWEGAAKGVRVNAIAPGHIDTRMARALAGQIRPGDVETSMADIAARVPMGRYGTPEEVANLVTWLLSDEASYVTGSVYLIDAGINA